MATSVESMEMRVLFMLMSAGRCAREGPLEELAQLKVTTA